MRQAPLISCTCSFVSLILKHIPKARTTDDVLSVGAYFLAQAGDIDIHGAIGHDDTSPDTVHQLLAREHLPTINQKQMEQRELRRREVHSDAIDSCRLLIEVQAQAAIAEQMLML